MHVPSLIEKKRNGGELAPEEIIAIVTGFTDGSIPDYQMSALLMAICWRGMTTEETSALTLAMLESGDRLSWPDASTRPRIVDKHSTGGIGDKVSLILAPLLACDGLWVPMISGRGLGITGGTLDKLEAIPGFRTDLTNDELQKQMQTVGCAITGQTGSICPADKKIYALRDVSGTVPSQPLIVASIMSKKLAESPDALVLDVKHGSGAFMKTTEDALSLARAMREVGRAMNVETHYQLTPMDEPLGASAGNALEVIEAIETLQGKGPADLTNLTLDLASTISDSSREELETHLHNGSAYAKFEAMVTAQGGDPKDLPNLAEIHRAPFVADVRAEHSGTVQSVDAETVGRAVLQLGAGRETADSDVDFAVGVDQIIKTGTSVTVGDSLLRVHANSKAELGQAAAAIHESIELS